MAITSVTKGLIGKKDINWDEDGTSSQFSKETSKGKTRSDFLVNADHVPVTSTTRNLSYADNTTVASKSDFHIDKVLGQLLAHALLTGLPSATHFAIAVSGGALTIKPLAITAAELATDAVETLKIKDVNVTRGKIALDAVDGTLIEDNAVNSEHVAAGALDHEHYALNSVGPENLDMDNAGRQPLFYPVWGVVDHNITTTTSSIVITGIVAQKTLTTSMGVTANSGTTSSGERAVTRAYVSGNNEVTIFFTGATVSGDKVTYMVWDDVTDKT